MKLAGLVILCFLIRPGILYSQGLALATVSSMDTLHIRFNFVPSFRLREAVHEPVSIPLKSPFRSPYNHYDDLGFFCKWELKLDKQVRKPIRFRLGSVDYVNRMEGK